MMVKCGADTTISIHFTIKHNQIMLNKVSSVKLKERGGDGCADDGNKGNSSAATKPHTLIALT